MGALHAGHLSLIEASKKENEITVSSIFVNPTQFNDPKDFEKYPNTIEKDIYDLEGAGCDILFLPPVHEIYPEGAPKNEEYDLGYAGIVLEAEFRPGHFRGVCQVMRRLLEIALPHRLYLGQKDYQQCIVIKKLIAILGLDVETRIQPTLREKNGLAMSSRNMRLSFEQREEASAIFATLNWVRNQLKSGAIKQLEDAAEKKLSDKGFKVDYVEIATAEGLELIDQWNGETKLVVLAAAFLGEVRLIDNLVLN